MPKSTFTIFVPEESVCCSFLRIFMKMFCIFWQRKYAICRQMTGIDLMSFLFRSGTMLQLSKAADAWLTFQNSLHIFVCECRLGSLFHDCPPPAICSKWAPECSDQRHAGRTKGWRQPTTKQLTFVAANSLVIRRMHSLYLNFLQAAPMHIFIIIVVSTFPPMSPTPHPHFHHLPLSIYLECIRSAIVLSKLN